MPQWLGRLEYRWALRLQRGRRRGVLQGSAPEAIWLLEHEPVITLGRRGGQVEASPRRPVVQVERGGLATWHGPGQLVGYLILDVGRRGGSVKGTVAAVERGIIDWLAVQGVAGARRTGLPGVWVGADKVCAVGMHFRRGVTLHGFALNLTCDLSEYEAIVPCGIRDGSVTSVASLGQTVGPVFAVSQSVGQCVRRALTNALDPLSARD